jgi:Uma2 family endonuclease
MNIVTLDLSAIASVTDEQFYQLCQANPDVSLERNRQGELIIGSPVGGESGSREADYIADLVLWNRQTRLGRVFSSSTIFNLPNGGDPDGICEAARSPDVAWVSLDRWNALAPEQQERFPPICPDFVIELRSRTDRPKPLQEKMQEYLESGLRLGWLVDPQSGQVEIYRAGQAMEVLQFPVQLSGESILPGFVLNL